MARDDLAFAAILIGSVVLSALLRLCPPRLRPDASALVGAGAILGACGRNAVHPFSGLLLALLVLHCAPVRRRAAEAAKHALRRW